MPEPAPIAGKDAPEGAQRAFLANDRGTTPNIVALIPRGTSRTHPKGHISYSAQGAHLARGAQSKGESAYGTHSPAQPKASLMRAARHRVTLIGSKALATTGAAGRPLCRVFAGRLQKQIVSAGATLHASSP